MDIAETVAKRVLEAILSGANLDYHSVQSNGEYDFDLRYAGGAIAAVEVTAAIDERHLGTLAAIYDPQKGGPIIRPTACEKSWIIFPGKGASINTIRAKADRYLAQLEREGIDNFFWTRRDVTAVKAMWRDLRIVFGSVISSDGEPTIEIGRPIGAGAVGPRLAIGAGEREARKQDNRKKLGVAKTAERHLVVYMPAGSLPWNALMSGVPPSTLPNIPEEITDIWLIGQGGIQNEFVAWHASTNQTWHSTRVICAPEGRSPR